MTDDSPRPSLHSANNTPALKKPLESQQGGKAHCVDILIHEQKWKTEVSFDLLECAEKCLLVTLQNIAKEKALFEVSILLTNDVEIQGLNKTYRQKDRPTNVLSFESGVPLKGLDNVTHPIPLGDIIFSYDTLKQESQIQNKSFQDHFTHLMIHGLLHLLGFDHLTDQEAEAMEALEITLLNDYFHINNPYRVT